MDRKVVEAKVDEVLNSKGRKAAASPQVKSSSSTQSRTSPMGGNPFAAFGAMGGMPDLSAMAGGTRGKVPLKVRLMVKLASFATHPTFSRFLKKKWWPLWLVVGVLFSGVILVVGVFYLLWKLLTAILRPYTELFKKK